MSKQIDWLNRLCKWRTFFAGWQLGTRPTTDPECAAIRDHRDLTMILRVEQTALFELLHDKGLITVDEFKEAIQDEAHLLLLDYERRFPGFTATDYGLDVDVAIANQTMRRMNFKP